jgi:hypothetical protein
MRVPRTELGSASLSSPGPEPRGSRVGEQTREPRRFRLGHAAAEGSQAVVATALVVVRGIGPLAQLLDEPDSSRRRITA